MSDSTLQTLRALVLEGFDVQPAQLDDHKPFTELGLDSLELVDFMFKAEDRFGVRIDYEQAMQQPTLAGLATLIDSLLAEVALPKAA
jgi:acyl carrier protein